MKLANWLEAKKMTRAAFAVRIGKSAGMVTLYCDGTIWPPGDAMQRIVAETGGDVMPNDFLSLPKTPAVQHEVATCA
jgi:hypothetical protein